MANTFQHIFFLKNPKNYLKGSLPVYIRITVSGKRSEISINKVADSDKWQTNPGRMKGRSEMVKDFNLFLLSIENKLYNAYRALILEKEILTAISLKNKYTGKDEKLRMLVPIFQKHNSQIAVIKVNCFRY